jgi:hypothetical protein
MPASKRQSNSLRLRTPALHPLSQTAAKALPCTPHWSSGSTSKNLATQRSSGGSFPPCGTRRLPILQFEKHSWKTQSTSSQLDRFSVFLPLIRVPIPWFLRSFGLLHLPWVLRAAKKWSAFWKPHCGTPSLFFTSPPKEPLDSSKIARTWSHK